MARELLRRPKGRRALVLGLRGPLGAGKTAFARGFLRAFGVRRRATSPTFVIARRFPIHIRGFRNIFHVDAYRLKGVRSLPALELGRALHDPRSVVLVEWAEKIRRALPRTTVWLTFSHGVQYNERIVTKK